MNLRMMATVAVALLWTAATPALAQDVKTPGNKNQFQPDSPAASEAPTPAESGTVKSLLGQGYEIRTILVIPRAVVTGGGSTVDSDAVMIVLQKADSLANCYVTYKSFADGSYYNGWNACNVLQ